MSNSLPLQRLWRTSFMMHLPILLLRLKRICLYIHGNYDGHPFTNRGHPMDLFLKYLFSNVVFLVGSKNRLRIDISFEFSGSQNIQFYIFCIIIDSKFDILVFIYFASLLYLFWNFKILLIRSEKYLKSTQFSISIPSSYVPGWD